MNQEQPIVPIDHIQRTVQQADVVEKLALQVKADPKDLAAAQQLEIEMERLAFYQNTAKGNPKARAARVIEIARSTVLSRAVTKPLPPLT